MSKPNKLFSIVLALGLAVSVRAETYTVTTDEGSYASPVSLDSLTVTDSGAATMTFAEAAAKFVAGDVFVKAGAGYVLSSDDMSKLKGGTSEIRITGGCLIMSKNGHIGAAADTSSTDTKKSSSPKVTVSDGATLALKTSAKCQIYNTVVLQGEGADGLGAFCYASNVDQTDYLAYGTWSFGADTLVTTKTSTRFDCAGTWSLKGHTVTFKANGKAGQVAVYSTWIVPGETGRLVFDGVVVADIGANWNGSAANTVVVTNGAVWRMYNSTAKPMWSLIWKADSTMEVNGTTDGRWGGDSTVNGWRGPVRIDSAAWRFAGNWSSPNAKNRGLWLDGDVSGRGGFYSDLVWLHLKGANNTYRGKTVVSGSATWPAGLGLYHPGSISADSAGIVMTNAPIRMATAESYALPPTAFHVADGLVESVDGASGGSIALLKKTGAGELVLAAPMSVTGSVELAEGKLTLAPPIAKTLYSAVPGMWEGYINTNGTAGSKAWSIATMNDGDRTVSCDKIVARPEMMETKAYPPWKDWMTVTYSGYIWNRSPTNETWTFAFACAGYYKFYWNGAAWASSSADDSGALMKYTVTVAPGAHQVIYKGNVRDYRSGISGTAGGKWPAYFGWALDRFGRKSSSSSDYIFPMNGAYGTLAGGDGFLLTRDSRDVGDFTVEELASLRRSGQTISNCVVRAGTVLDLACTNGVDAVVSFASFAGANTITNGSVRFDGDWKLTADEKSAWPLRVTNGDMTFGADATLSIDVARGLRGATVYDILTVSGEIRGLPTLAGDLAEAATLRVKPGDPKTLQLERRLPGLMILLK